MSSSSLISHRMFVAAAAAQERPPLQPSRGDNPLADNGGYATFEVLDPPDWPPLESVEDRRDEACLPEDV